MPFLCEDLVEEIFSWLPVKTLVRFSCLSKSCKSLISDSYFVKLHLHRSSSRNSDFTHARLLISCHTDDSGRGYISSGSVSSLLESDSATVASQFCIPGNDFIGTCNGLIALHSSEFIKSDEKYIHHVRFWNPATRSMSQDSPPFEYRIPSGCLSDTFRFGYDCSSDTYKVVAVNQWGTVANVYNMGGNCWRTIHVSSLPYWDVVGHHVYVSNTVNWLAYPDIIDDTDPDRIIVSFDLGKEELTQLSLPHGLQNRDEFYCGMLILGVLRDSLCVSLTEKKTDNFVVWQMKEFGVHKSWTKLISVFGGSKIYESVYFPTCLSENGDALLISQSSESQVLLYNGRDNKLEVTKIANYIVGSCFENYIESLVSPC